MMIDRRMLIGALAGGCLAAPFAADAQTTEKVWRIGFLGIAPPGTSPESERLFAAGKAGLSRARTWSLNGEPPRAGPTELPR